MEAQHRPAMRTSSGPSAVAAIGYIAIGGAALYGSIVTIEGLAAALHYADEPLRLARNAFIEEGAKAVLLFVSATANSAAAKKTTMRARSYAAARGLSLGLAAVAAFAALETFVYFLAFPSRGTVMRLLWSLPTHLVAAFATALGAAEFLVKGQKVMREALCFLCGFFSAVAWHLAANLLAAQGPAPWIFVVWSIANFAALFALGGAFLKNVLLGGFLHGQS